jgi:hypothetical protein
MKNEVSGDDFRVCLLKHYKRRLSFGMLPMKSMVIDVIDEIEIRLLLTFAS